MALVNNDTYLLITPLKDEVRYIGTCIQSVVDQVHPPSLWIIVDDGCTDGSADVVREWMDSHPWIELLSLEKGEWDLGIHYSEVCMKGFDRAISRAREETIDWQFIGLLDADIRLDPEYFRDLQKEMQVDDKLGIASGHLAEPGKDGTGKPRINENNPMGGARLWKRKCFDSAQYVSSFAPDSVSNVKARLGGWTTRLFPNITGEQLRAMGESHGRCQGAILWGRSSHFLGSGPLFALLKGLKLLTRFPCYPGLCYLRGYFTSFLMRREQIADAEVIEYYAHRKLRDYL
jgi:glycosyltransferase involved in cell wall biosynthesis